MQTQRSEQGNSWTLALSQCCVEGLHLQVQAMCKWPIYWLQPWHLLLSQSIKHCRLASLDLSWAQQGSPPRLSVGREPWSQSSWMRAEMELIPNLSTETLVLLAASLVLVYMWVAVQAPLLTITEFGVICRTVSFPVKTAKEIMEGKWQIST